MTHNFINIFRPLCLTAVFLGATALSVQADPASFKSPTVKVQKPILLAQVQPAKKPKKKKKKSVDKNAPKKKQTAAQKKKRPWIVQCGTFKKSGKKFCRIQQNLLFKKTGQRLLSVIIQPQPFEPKLALQLSLPHGLYLPAGTAYKIDDAEEVRLEIETCDAEGCYASAAVDDKLSAVLKKGKTMRIGFQATNRKPVTIPVTLDGFVPAFNRIMMEE